MSAPPILITDVGLMLQTKLYSDSLMQQYAPGGFWLDNPPDRSGQAWVSTTTYARGFSVCAVGTDGLLYYSVASANLGNDPTTTTGYWNLVYPRIRAWEVTPGSDCHRQDGAISWVMSKPQWVVCIVDKQTGGNLDYQAGSQGNFALGAARILALLQPPGANPQFSLNGYQWVIWRLGPYRLSGQSATGNYNPALGHRFQIMASPLA